MTRFDLLLSRAARTPVTEGFGELLLDELKLPAADVATLLNQGWARIRLDAEEAAAGAYSSRLAAIGVKSQLIDARRPTPPGGLELLGVSGEPVEQAQPIERLRPDVERMVEEEVLGPIPLETAEPEGSAPIEIPQVRLFPALAPTLRCPTCDALLSVPGAVCTRCQESRTPGLRLRLRRSPPLRVAVGLALALLVGGVGTLPYERHLFRAVSVMEHEAVRLRARPDPRLQAQGLSLQIAAEDQAQIAAAKVGAVWLVLSAMTLAFWLLLL